MIPVIIPVDKETYDSMCVEFELPTVGELVTLTLLMVVWVPIWYFAIDWYKEDPGWFMRWPVVNGVFLGVVSLYSSLATMILRLLR